MKKLGISSPTPRKPSSHSAAVTAPFCSAMLHTGDQVAGSAVCALHTACYWVATAAAGGRPRHVDRWHQVHHSVFQVLSHSGGSHLRPHSWCSEWGSPYDLQASMMLEASVDRYLSVGLQTFAR